LYNQDSFYHNIYYYDKCLPIPITGHLFTLCATMTVDVGTRHDVMLAEAKLIKTVDPKQLVCLANAIYYEAGRESLTGQAAVARVVINRVNHGFASNPCKVVYQTNIRTKIDEYTQEERLIKVCQFSWVCEDKPKPSDNNPTYRQAKQVAYNVLAFDAYKEVVPKTTLFFHNLTVDPLWPYHKVKQIGNHIFYSKKKPHTHD
jgi:spore germination cell wall hydrolase CwlJ-like protein